MSKWPFAIDDNNGDWTIDDILSYVRKEFERWHWGEGGTPAAKALLDQVSVDAAMVVVQESLRVFQNADGLPVTIGFSFEPGAEPTLVMPITNLEALSVTVDLEAVMLHHSVYVHERKQMTDMAACLRRIADRYEQAADEIDWVAVEADRLDGTARPFYDGTASSRGPIDDFHDMMMTAMAPAFEDMIRRAMKDDPFNPERDPPV